MSETLALYKLIILQMLQKIDFPLTNGQISEFILDKGYTNYFKLQQAISEMVDTGFLLRRTGAQPHFVSFNRLRHGDNTILNPKSHLQFSMTLMHFFGKRSMI